MLLRASPWLFALLLSACAVRPPVPPAPLPAPPVPTPSPQPIPAPPPAPPALIPTPTLAYPTLKPADWSTVAFWQDDAVSEAWPALLQSCSTLKKQSAWQAVCNDAATLATPDDATVRAFFEQRFQPYQATQEDGSAEGLITGYYEPLLKGDRVRTATRTLPLVCGARRSDRGGSGERLPRVEKPAPAWTAGRQQGRALPHAQGNRGAGRQRQRLQGQADCLGRRCRRPVLPADPGLGPHRAARRRLSARRLRRSERPSLPVDRQAAGRTRRAEARTGIDAGHQGLGGEESRQAARTARQQSQLRVLPRTARTACPVRWARSAYRSPAAARSPSTRASSRSARRCFSPPPSPIRRCR